MHKVILMILLVVVSSSAMAKWVEISGNETIGVTTYVDPTTIRKKGNKVKLWQLYDYKTSRKLGTENYLSVKDQREFDCEEEQIQILYSIYYLENMGDGESIGTYGNLSGWSPVAPETIDQVFLKFACGK